MAVPVNRTFTGVVITDQLPIVMPVVPTSGVMPPSTIFTDPQITVDNSGRIRSIEEGAGGGGVNSVTSGNPDTIIIGGAPADPTVAANTALVTTVSPNLATGAEIANYVNTVLSGGPLVYQGGYNAATNTPDLTGPAATVNQGSAYTVTVAGTFYTEQVEVGDLLIAETTIAAGAGTLADWTTVQNNIGVATTTTPGIVSVPVPGGLTVSGAGALSMPPVGATGTYANLPTISVDTQGRVTSASDELSIAMSTRGVAGIGAPGNSALTNVPTNILWSGIALSPAVGNKITFDPITNFFTVSAQGWYRVTCDFSAFGSADERAVLIQLVDVATGTILAVSGQHITFEDFAASYGYVGFNRIMRLIPGDRYIFEAHSQTNGTSNVPLNLQYGGMTVEWLAR